MVAIFVWHVATRAIYEQKEEYMNELFHHIFLFLEFLCGIYDDKEYSLEESIRNFEYVGTQIFH